MNYSHRSDQASREWKAEERAHAQEIGPLPFIVNPERRESCREDFGLFCKTYGADAFPLPWSPYHLEAIRRITAAVQDGGQFAFAMPRASGKSTLCRWAVKWAICYGYRRYIVFVTATDGLGLKQLRAVKSVFRFNPLLAEDFPEICHPIRSLEGESRKAPGQKLMGIPTEITWNADQLITAQSVVDDPRPWPEEMLVRRYDGLYTFRSAAATIEAVGITGDIRGRFQILQSGEIFRPDLGIVDDPQTRESAKSPQQCLDREATIAGDVAYLAGPGVPFAMCLPCTVIYEGDLAERMLDRKLHPEFQGCRSKMLDRMPTNEKLWEQYADILRQEWEDGATTHPAATAFYAANRAAMDEGADAAWPERYGPHELSAIQSAMNLKIKDEQSFQAECQNEPIGGRLDAIELPTESELCARTNGLKRGVVSADATTVTAMIDVSEKVLWWGVAGFGSKFSGAVVDYGTWPAQQTNYVTLSSVRFTLEQAAADALGQSVDFNAALLHGLNALCESILDREWVTETGTAVRIDRCLVDANWSKSMETVYTFCRRSKWAGTLMPSHGHAVPAKNKPLCDPSRREKMKAGERWGLQWRIAPAQTGGRRIVFDTNFWKSFLFNRCALPVGADGAFSVFAAKPAQHRMLAEQMLAEYAVRVRAKGRTVDEWQLLPGKKDEHFLDVFAGCHVAASVNGVALPGQCVALTKPARKKKRAGVQYIS